MNLKNRMKSDSLIREPIEKEKLQESSEKPNMHDTTQKSNQPDSESLLHKQSERIRQQEDEILKQSVENRKLSDEKQRLAEENQKLSDEVQKISFENHKLSEKNRNQSAEIQNLSHTVKQKTNEIQKQNEEIQKLSSENQKLQLELQKQTKELLKKSEQLVKRENADLILKENKQLIEKDRQRENELKETKRKAEAEVQACKDEYEGKSQLLDYYTNIQKKKIEEYNQKINEQDKLIDESAELKYKKYKISLDKKYDKKNSELNAAYLFRNTFLNTQLFSSILYGAIVTLLTAAKSDIFIEDIKNFFIGLINVLIKYAGLTLKAGKAVAIICTRVDNPTAQNILYWIVTILIIVILIGIPVLIIYFSAQKYITWYKEEICDSISLWVAVISLALTIFLSAELKLLIPINLIVTYIITHLIYSGIRAYVRGCKRNRGYY